jgi:N utilization substance protein B
MTRRSRAREVALQLLFQRDFNPAVERAAMEQFARERLRDETLQAFCLKLFDGVTAHQADIDQRITAAAENWRLHRMPAVDRNILRLGTFELVHDDDTPGPVAVDEAIELAKRFGSGDSAGYVNGVLDRVRRMNLDDNAEPPAADLTADASTSGEIPEDLGGEVV